MRTCLGVDPGKDGAFVLLDGRAVPAMPLAVALSRERARRERRRTATLDELRHARQERDRSRLLESLWASWTVEYVLVCGDL